MRRIADTISRLNRPISAPSAVSGSSTLQPLTAFGSNPGALKGWYYAPAGETPTALVVVLHGCTQTAAGYDAGSGWTKLAARHGFAVLFPEQQRQNNANLCFNWFADADIARDAGEALSIRQMVGTLVDRLSIDPARVHVTGLSAGGAMTAVMLATYPDVFASGAVIAGLPYGSATTMPQAFDRMRGVGHGSPADAVARVRAASPHDGRWPALSIWHGTADRTVDIVNADALADQWRSLHEIAAAPDRIDTVDGQDHRVWLDRQGNVAVEEYRIAGMGHGTPLAKTGDRAAGAAGPFMLDVGISSTWHIANRWGLIGDRPAAADRPKRAATKPAPSTPASPTFDVYATIETALRSAGLMR